MITPLAQRQMYQTANVEAVRQAHEVSEAIQRDQVKQQAADEQLAEEKDTVRVIPRSQELRAEERREGRRRRDTSQAPPEPEDDSADSAEGHVDFLA